MGAFFSSGFDPATDIPSLKGKVIIVTGGNHGIGYGTVKHLARHGAKVYMAARNESKATGAMASLEADGLGPDNGQVIWHPLDLSDPRLVKKSAEEFLKREERLDILINNAALLHSPYDKIDGITDMMVVNHIGPFVFTQYLLPLLKKTAEEPGSDIRIVNVASDAHRFLAKGTRFKSIDDFNREMTNAWFPFLSRYALSKYANVLWTNELQRRLNADGVPIITVAVHPGGVNTFEDRLTGIKALGIIIVRLFFKTWDQGAYNSVIAATSPVIRQQPERYMAGYIQGKYGKLREPSEDTRDPEITAELWAVTEGFLKSIGVI